MMLEDSKDGLFRKNPTFGLTEIGKEKSKRGTRAESYQVCLVDGFKSKGDLSLSAHPEVEYST